MADTVLDDQYVNDAASLTIGCTHKRGSSKGDPKAVTSAVAVLYDPNRADEITGTADSGSTTNFTDADLADLGANFLKGMPCKITKADGSSSAEPVITAYDTATGSCTLSGMPWAVAAGDTLTLPGYPLISETACTVGGTGSNEVTLATTGSNAHSYTNIGGDDNGKRVVAFFITYTSGEKDTCRAVYNVLRR